VSDAKHSQSHLLVLQMIAGAGAGAFAKTATAPLERIKIIFQVQVRRRVVGGSTRGCARARCC